MNTVANSERPKLKLNLAAKPLTLNTNDKKDEAIGTTKTKSKEVKKGKKQEAVASNKQVASSKKEVNQIVVANPEEILKEKIKRRKKEYFSILTKLKADFPVVFSEEPKPLAIGIDLELKKILNGQFPNNQLNRFFHRYCGSFKYKETLVEGAQRFNLDGTPATLVTKKEVPVMISRPRFTKKSRDASDTPANVSNVIDLSNE